MTQGAHTHCHTLWQPKGVVWRWEMGGKFKREGTYVYLWLIHVDVWQKPMQHYKVIILQLKRTFVKKIRSDWNCHSSWPTRVWNRTEQKSMEHEQEHEAGGGLGIETWHLSVLKWVIIYLLLLSSAISAWLPNTPHQFPYSTWRPLVATLSCSNLSCGLRKHLCNARLG